jgi:hypothetical protein
MLYEIVKEFPIMLVFDLGISINLSEFQIGKNQRLNIVMNVGLFRNHQGDRRLEFSAGARSRTSPITSRNRPLQLSLQGN